MTIQEFDLLLDIEKEETVLDLGRFISTHHFDDKIFDTYRIDSFYVQFYYNLEGNETTRIICFPDTNDLFSHTNRRN